MRLMDYNDPLTTFDPCVELSISGESDLQKRVRKMESAYHLRIV